MWIDFLIFLVLFIWLCHLKAGREDIISTSDVQSTMTVDPDGAKKNIQDSDVPATTGKRRPGARNVDMSETANESSGEREGPTPAEKKQR